MHTDMGVFERAIQTIKKVIKANLEDNLCLAECGNRSLNVKRFVFHTGPKLTPFEFHYRTKPRIVLTNLI